jgi:aspartyl-tRNA(Asn)/glutamyl-tRNA(Gln) amidotransferase subunit A
MAADQRAEAGLRLGPLDGVIVTIKDLFDVAGEVTRAGSALLASEAAPASADAVAVKRLRAAGAVIVAKTNMTEFAFSGVGTNPHFGTPGNPRDRARIPGGSTSGGAVAVADGMCDIAVGTDTGGSTRIPAAVCGIVGFTPTRRRVPTDGAFPLSFTLDSVGPMAKTVAECAAADAVLAGQDERRIEAASLGGLRIGLVQGFPLDGLDRVVAMAFDDALARLGRAGVMLRDVKSDAIEAVSRVGARGGIVPAEAFAIHRDRLARSASRIDPHIVSRIRRGEAMSAADYVTNLRERAAAIELMNEVAAEFDALIMPTTPMTAPLMADVVSAEDFDRLNALLLRNTATVNFLDQCAMSLPLPVGDALPCGLMLIGRADHDGDLFEIGLAVERLLAD